MKYVYERLFDLAWPDEESTKPAGGSLLALAQQTFKPRGVQIVNVMGLTGPPRQLVVSFTAGILGTRPNHRLVIAEKTDNPLRFDGFNLDLSHAGLGGRYVGEGGSTVVSYLYDVFETWLSTAMEEE